MTRRPSAMWWGVAVIFGLIAAPPAQADKKADALIKEMTAATRAVKTLTADFSTTFDFGAGQVRFIRKGTLKLQRPNLLRVETDEMILASDGRLFWNYDKSENTFTRKLADPRMFDLDLTNALGVFGIYFFETGRLLPGSAQPDVKARFLPRATVAGTPCRVVELTQENTGGATIVRKIYIGADGLVHRLVQTNSGENQTNGTVDVALSNVRVGRPLTAVGFAFAPPAAAKLEGSAKLLAEGEEGPKFSLPTPQGGQISLGAALNGKKALLINFWTYY